MFQADKTNFDENSTRLLNAINNLPQHFKIELNPYKAEPGTIYSRVPGVGATIAVFDLMGKFFYSLHQPDFLGFQILLP